MLVKEADPPVVNICTSYISQENNNTVTTNFRGMFMTAA